MSVARLPPQTNMRGQEGHRRTERGGAFEGLPGKPNVDGFAELERKEEKSKNGDEALRSFPHFGNPARPARILDFGFWIADLQIRNLQSPIGNRVASVGFAVPAHAGCAFVVEFQLSIPAISPKPLPSISTLPNGASGGQANLLRIGA